MVSLESFSIPLIICSMGVMPGGGDGKEEGRREGGRKKGGREKGEKGKRKERRREKGVGEVLTILATT